MKEDITALYHYTSVGGLKGIIESGCIHATNIKYLNDSKEFIFGLDYFSKIFPHPDSIFQLPVPEGMPLYDHFIESLINQTLSTFRYRRESSNYFVISFSKNPDVLSQWRAYGKENAGYCIKFHYGCLFYPSDSLDGMISKVEYINPDDLTLSRERLESIKNSDWKPELLKKMPWLATNDIDEYEKMLAKMKELYKTHSGEFSIPIDEFETDKNYPDKVDLNDNNPDWYTAIDAFDFFVIEPTLANIAYSWKHHSFYEEEEYRLVIQRDDELLSTLEKRPVKFKEGKTFLVPYIEIPYDFKNKKIIEEVIVGPCPHPNEAASSVQQFLERNLNNAVKVIDSKIPYRFW